MLRAQPGLVGVTVPCLSVSQWGFTVLGGVVGKESHGPRLRGAVEPKRRDKTACVCGQGPVRAAEGGGGTQLLPSVFFCPEGRRVLATPQRQVGTQPSCGLQWCWGLSPRALGSACPGLCMSWHALWHLGPRGVEGLRLACSLVSDKPWVGEA